MKHLKRDLLIVACGILACVAAARSQQLPDAPSATHHKLVAPVEWQPTHKHLKFITNHPTRTAIIAIIAGGLAGAFIARTPHCHHYEYGHNGVDVPCPVETSGK